MEEYIQTVSAKIINSRHGGGGKEELVEREKGGEGIGIEIFREGRKGEPAK